MTKEKASATAAADGRARSWAAVVYPESAPENWRDILDQLHIEWAESPLHNLDTNESTGELKKAHWHIVLCFDGKKSFDQVKAILDEIHAPIPQVCHSMRGAIRYMAHLDNPEKHQYSLDQIVPHGGIDIKGLLAPTATERNAIVKDICAYIRKNDLTELEDVMNIAMDDREDWWSILNSGSLYVVKNYLASKRHRYDALNEQKQREAEAEEWHRRMVKLAKDSNTT